MPLSISTLTIKDGAGASKTVKVVDWSGVGSGPYSFVTALVNADGDAILNIDDAGRLPVSTDGDLIDVTLSLDTSAYADGDVMADTQSVSNAFRLNGGRAILQSVQVLDEDDVGQTFDIIFLSANNALGTENSAPTISDSNARDILGRVRITDTDYIDLGGCKMATKTGIGLMLEAAGGSTTLYLGTIIRGAGTYTASGVRLKLGLLWD